MNIYAYEYGTWLLLLLPSSQRVSMHCMCILGDTHTLRIPHKYHICMTIKHISLTHLCHVADIEKGQIYKMIYLNIYLIFELNLTPLFVFVVYVEFVVCILCVVCGLDAGDVDIAGHVNDGLHG
jgi:hypothetical protein